MGKLLHIRIDHTISIPDRLRLARYRRMPELGPRVLFFSGGSALRALSTRLLDYTHNSIHLITPFDSGGSSAGIRKSFDMLAVGDIRNRIMALADQTVHGNPEVYKLFSHRFPGDATPAALRTRLERMATARDFLVARVPNPMRRVIRNHLHGFLDLMPADFDLRGASIGNLILTSGYLHNRRHIEPVIYMFSRLVEARGTVRPVTGLSYHLGARLSDGETVRGQHLLTGDAFAQRGKKIRELFFLKRLESRTRSRVVIKKKTADLIKTAELICYPCGSFYTSLIATVMPDGVGQAIAESGALKVYVPNPCPDPEQFGMTLRENIETLLRYARASCSRVVDDRQLLQIVVIDSRRGNYGGPVNTDELHALGLTVIDTELLAGVDPPVFDEERLVSVLLSLV